MSLSKNPLERPAHAGIHTQRNRSFSLSLLALSVSVGLSLNAHADWPQFRGPYGNGQAAAAGDTKPIGLPLHWSETENVKWKTEIPYQGWSTPVVMGGQVWLTTATPDGHDFYAVCIDEATGKILFNEKLFHSDNPEPLGNNVNCYATPSPVIEAGRVYVHFGSYGTACLDTSNGKVVWQRTDLPCRHFRGPSSSPVIFQNLLILTLDGIDLQYTVALDKQTGKTVWKTDRSAEWNDNGKGSAPGDMRKSHSTPFITQIDGKYQMLSPGAKSAYSYDPLTGKEIWKVHHNDYSAAPVPLVDNGLVYLITGRAKTELWAVKPDGHGDVTDSNIVWKLTAHVGKSASPVLVDGLIYMVADESFLSCVDEKTGEVVWIERMGGSYQASPVVADGRIYFFDQAGKSIVVKPGRTYEPLATNTLADGFMASPAISDKAFFLRTRTHLYRVEDMSAEKK